MNKHNKQKLLEIRRNKTRSILLKFANDEYKQYKKNKTFKINSMAMDEICNTFEKDLVIHLTDTIDNLSDNLRKSIDLLQGVTFNIIKRESNEAKQNINLKEVNDEIINKRLNYIQKLRKITISKEKIYAILRNKYSDNNIYNAFNASNASNVLNVNNGFNCFIANNVINNVNSAFNSEYSSIKQNNNYIDTEITPNATPIITPFKEVKDSIKLNHFNLHLDCKLQKLEIIKAYFKNLFQLCSENNYTDIRKKKKDSPEKSYESNKRVKFDTSSNEVIFRASSQSPVNKTQRSQSEFSTNKVNNKPAQNEFSTINHIEFDEEQNTSMNSILLKNPNKVEVADKNDNNIENQVENQVIDNFPIINSCGYKTFKSEQLKCSESELKIENNVKDLNMSKILDLFHKSSEISNLNNENMTFRKFDDGFTLNSKSKTGFIKLNRKLKKNEPIYYITKDSSKKIESQRELINLVNFDSIGISISNFNNQNIIPFNEETNNIIREEVVDPLILAYTNNTIVFSLVSSDSDKDNSYKRDSSEKKEIELDFLISEENSQSPSNINQSRISHEQQKISVITENSLDFDYST